MVYTHKEVFELLRLCVTQEKVTVGMADLVQGQVRSAKVKSYHQNHYLLLEVDFQVTVLPSHHPALAPIPSLNMYELCGKKAILK